MQFNDHENLLLVNKQYGKWNAIFVTDGDDNCVFYQNHSEMFPESLDEWVDGIRKSYINSYVSPVRMDIDITNLCPDNCIVCFSKELNKKYRDTIPLLDLIAVFDNFKKLGGKSVRLTGGGDPLNHPDIVEIIEHLFSVGLKITIETNGDLLSEKIINTVAKCVNHMRISVDSFDNISRKKVHAPSNQEYTYDNLLENIKLIKEKTVEFGRDKILFLGTTFVILPENYFGVTKFISDMYDLGVDWVALRKNIYREVYNDNPKILPLVEAEINEFKKGLPLGDPFIIEDQYGVSFVPQHDFEQCLVSKVRLIVLANKSLQLCCLSRNGLIPKA